MNQITEQFIFMFSCSRLDLGPYPTFLKVLNKTMTIQQVGIKYTQTYEDENNKPPKMCILKRFGQDYEIGCLNPHNPCKKVQVVDNKLQKSHLEGGEEEQRGWECNTGMNGSFLTPKGLLPRNGRMFGCLIHVLYVQKCF